MEQRFLESHLNSAAEQLPRYGLPARTPRVGGGMNEG